MHGNGALALVAVRGQTSQMQHFIAWKQLTFVGAVKQFVIARKHWLDLCRVQQLEPYRTEIPVSVNADIAVTPQGAGDHEVVQQGES